MTQGILLFPIMVTAFVESDNSVSAMSRGAQTSTTYADEFVLGFHPSLLEDTKRSPPIRRYISPPVNIVCSFAVVAMVTWFP